MASTLNPTPMIPFIQNYLARRSGDINDIARSLGIPATAIASAVAQEMSDVYYDAYIPNAIGAGGSVLVTVKSLKDQFLDNRALSNSHQQIADDFAAREAIIRSGLKPSVREKILNPTADDAGPGNVNLGQAILALKRYMADPANADDPLGLAKYAGDYHLLAKDLIDLDSPTTFAIAGLITKQGYDNFAKIYGPAFTEASEADQAALLTKYYKQGLQRILGEDGKNHPNFVATPDGGVSPRSQTDGFDRLPDPATGDGGPFVLRNFGIIKNILSGKQGLNAPQDGAVSDTQQEAFDDRDSSSAMRTGLEQRAAALGIDYAGYMPTSALLAAIHQQEAAEAQPHEADGLADRIEHEIDTVGLPLMQNPKADAPPQRLMPLTRAGLEIRGDRLGIPYTTDTPSDQLLVDTHSIDAMRAPPSAAPALADHIERDIDQMAALANLPGFNEEQNDVQDQP